MARARSTFEMAMSGPRSNRSAKAPAGSASKSHGRLSAATTEDTARGWGLTTTAISGTAPAANPSPELARENPSQSRVNGRPSRFRLIRCFARLDCTRPSRHVTQIVTPSHRFRHNSPLAHWRDSGGGHLSVQQIR